MSDGNSPNLDPQRNAFCFAASQGDTGGMRKYLKEPGMTDPLFAQVIMSGLASAVMAEQPATTQLALGYMESYRLFPESFVREFFKDSQAEHAFINKAVDTYKEHAKSLDEPRNAFCAAAATGDMAEIKSYISTVGTKDPHFDMVLTTGFALAHFGQHMDAARAIHKAAVDDSTLPQKITADMQDMLDGKKPPTLGDNFGPTGKGLNPNR